MSYIGPLKRRLFCVAAALLLLGVGYSPYAQGPAPAAKQLLREMTLGQPMSDSGVTGSVFGYQISMSEGTTVVCQLGERTAPPEMKILFVGAALETPADVVPNASATGALYALTPGVVEPLMIVAERTGSYVLRIRFRAAGKYSITCAAPRPTVDKDKRYAEAQRLELSSRTEYEGKPNLALVLSNYQARTAVFTELGDQVGVALSEKEVAWAYYYLSDHEKAIYHLRQALKIFEELKSYRDIDLSLYNIARFAEAGGDVQLSIDTYGQLIRAARSMGTPLDEATAHNNLAVTYHRLADEPKAREHYARLLDFARGIQPPTVESLNQENLYYTNMANLVRGMNGGEVRIDAFAPRTPDDYRAAIEYLRGAMAVNDRMESLFRRSANLHTFNLLQMANSYKELGEYEQALAFLNRFAAHPTSANNAQRARVKILFGSVYAKMGDMGKATEYFDEVLRLMRAGANPGNTYGYLHLIAGDYFEKGMHQRSLELLHEALALARAQSSPRNVANSLFEIARVEREIGNFSNARKAVEEAIEVAESIRARITVDELRASFFSSVKRYYEFHTDLLMQTHKAQPEKGFDRLALETSERGRSRSLLDLLRLSGVKVEKAVSPEHREKERALRDLVSKRADEHSRLILNGAPAAAVEVALKAVTEATAEHSSVRAEMQRLSQAYAGITPTSTLDAGTIRGLLDSGTVMLEYALGEKKSYVWVISADAIHTFDLPSRDSIEADARSAYEHMTARNKVVDGETPERRNSRLRESDAAFARHAASLSDKVLGPAAKLIANKRLVIVPDGALHYVPFAALPLPQPAGQSVPVAAVHEVVSLPSASVLARLREERAARRPVPNMLAVFADPVFNQADTRFSTGRRQRTGADSLKRRPTDSSLVASRDFERAVEAAGFGSGSGEAIALPRLPFSRREAESIFSVSPQRLSLKRTDFEASKTEVFSAGLDKYKTVHFATHALLNSQHPELSGIVLSLVDKNGANVDGYLRLHDIYNLKLNADLVVLSACNTALGKEIKGEGVIGLTRGFMYAGSPRVVASLWKVDDSATAALMTIFYRKMHVDNMRPAAALRAAQVEMMKDSRWRSPYHWAPFVLHGEWK